MPRVTFPQCSPGYWSYVHGQCPDGASVTTPQPIERRDVNVTLIDLTVNITTGGLVAFGGAAAFAAWILRTAAFMKSGPNVYVDSKPIPLDQAKLTKAIEESRHERPQNQE